MLGNRWDSSHTMRMGLAGLAESMLWRSSVSDHTHDGDDGHVVEFGVVQTVEEVHGARTGRGHAHADPAGELRVPDGFECSHLLVARLNELGVVFGAAPGGEDAVDAVPGIGKHVRHIPIAQAL